MKNKMTILRKLLLPLSLTISCFTLTFAEPLPSWQDGPIKDAIINIVTETTTEDGEHYLAPKDRIATFDQDGTLWVEQPLYTQVIYVIDKIQQMTDKHPELKTQEPYKTILEGNMEALSKIPKQQLKAALVAELTNREINTYKSEVEQWLNTAKDQRWGKQYTDLTYLPMQELLTYLRANDYKTFIVTGGGQTFVRVYSDDIYGIPTEQIMGTAFEMDYQYHADDQSYLYITPEVLIDTNFSGKAKGIELSIGKRPIIAVGNSTGDREMLEYTTSGDGLRLGMLIFHDDAIREYAYGPAQGLPSNGIGEFTQELYDEAIEKDWKIISMKDQWKQIFSFDTPISSESQESIQ